MEKYQAAIKENKVAVIDCHAVWCGPCKMIAPFFEKYSKEFANVAFFKLDVDEVPDVAAELGVRSMPTFIFFEEGKRYSEFVGANWRALEEHLKKYREPKVEEPTAGEPEAGEPKAEEPKVEGKVAETPKVAEEPGAAGEQKAEKME